MTLYKCIYLSPIGRISLIATDKVLLGAWFEGQSHFEAHISETPQDEKNQLLQEACQWLDAYFKGENPSVPSFLSGQGTAFQKQVWQQLEKIPYGQTSTYATIAEQINSLSARAVGGAIGKNPLSIFVPCHRVLASNGKMTGYAAGIDKKIWLLEHEKSKGVM
ncbi:methylated-DNA--[protein]-cysteine S-methyltransferase [Streptococcus didelphis]|uniref:methylated-DNA--[protein]-cysteine S-methyltransferase n=1 Tax=Streptococcus didelphis TaxID=102886 RepID=UPI000370E5DE|nr:methylated-DNA--[protein]-cysteine S-methyltransferase [Streptococcus didelphis]